MPNTKSFRPSIPHWLYVSLLLSCLLTSPHLAFADGKVFSHATPVVTIPDQAALIHYQDGVQYLAIETRFEGEGQDFAWVVPLPSVPEIEEVTTGLFPTLRSLFAPEFIHRVTAYWQLALYLFFAGIIITIAYKQSGPTGTLAVIFLFVATLFLLPTLNKSRGLEDTPSGLAVLERKIVGSFETTTLQSDSPTALLDWLTENGYKQPKSAQPVIEEYVKQGWVFVASRLHRDATTGFGTPHPLGFRFKTDKPVYPLKLTAVDNGPLEIELFVFAGQRAKANHFEVELCDQPEYPKRDKYGERYEYWEMKGSHPITHPGLKRIVNDAKVVTKLKATLTPNQMTQDAYLSWETYQPAKATIYSHEAAWMIGVNIAVPLGILVLAFTLPLQPKHKIRWGRLGLAIIGLYACSFTIPLKAYITIPLTAFIIAYAFYSKELRSPSIRRFLITAAGIGLCLITAVIIYSALPKREAKLGAHPVVFESFAKNFTGEAMLLFETGLTPDTSHDSYTPEQIKNIELIYSDPKAYRSIESMSAFINRYYQYYSYRHDTQKMNPREEDSPNNYTLRQLENGVQYIWYDQYGGDHPTEFTDASIEKFAKTRRTNYR